MGYIFLSDDYIMPFTNVPNNGLLCCQYISGGVVNNKSLAGKIDNSIVKLFGLYSLSNSGITYNGYYVASLTINNCIMSYSNSISTGINSNSFNGPNTGTKIYYGSVIAGFDSWRGYVNYLPEEALNLKEVNWQSMIDDGIWEYQPITIPITYIPINSTLSGPDTASSGDTVSVDVSFPDGYIYRETGISVYDTNGAIAHSYDPATGKLTFIMP